MKSVIILKSLCLVFLLFISSSEVLSGQTISREVVSSNGESSVADINGVSYGLLWTIGEPISESFTASKKILTQGFVQGSGYIKDTIGLVDDTLKNENINRLEVNVFIYPNPTKGPLNMEISSLSKENCSVEMELLSTAGRRLRTFSSNSLPVKEIFDIYEYETGIYFLRISLKKKDEVSAKKISGNKVYKIVKI